MYYKMYVDKAGEWRWNLHAANHQIVATSGEGYKNKNDCLHGINLVKSSSDAPVNE